MIAVSLAAAWGAPSGLDVARIAASAASIAADAEHISPWGAASRLDNGKTMPWGVAARTDHAAQSRWGIYQISQTAARIPWGMATSADRSADAPWGAFTAHPYRAAFVPWGHATVADRASDAPWGAFTRHPATIMAAIYAASLQADQPSVIPWGAYQQRLSLPVNVTTPDGTPTLVIPLQRTYIVINDVSLERVSDSLKLPATSINLSIDAETWTWGFNATLPTSALDDVIGSPGAPVELAAWINGTQFRLLVERIARARSFARNTINISGRGIAAALDAPYAAPVSLYSEDAITAQQAAEAAITGPDLPAGWTIDWNLTDWLLPAGIWSHQGSPMSAVNRIAAAAGGYVQADANSQVLHVNARYPSAPWDWSSVTIDYEIPSAIATTEAIEWADNPDYDVVYVSGEVGGVLGRVLRTGEAGSRPAQMVTDNLITHVDAARQRGLSILGATGRIANISLSMPVLSEFGIIMPGSMVEYVDGATTRIGITRGVSINTKFPTVRQTVEIETHE